MVLVILSAFYGACMGTFALLREGGPVWQQLIASTVKVPLLFFATLAITLPSLYVSNALVGSRLQLPSLWRLLVASLAVNIAVLASLGPIVAFFSFTTTSHPFMVLLNVAVFAASGILGMMFLIQTLNRLSIVDQRYQTPRHVSEASRELASSPDTSETSSGQLQENGANEPYVEAHVADDSVSGLDSIEGHVLGRHVKQVFAVWVVLFGLVGAQMGWILRPFIGSPELPFEWFRERGSNFFEAVWNALVQLFS